MHVGNSPIVRAYKLCDDLGECVQLAEGDQEKDLGVWFTSDLKPSLHCCKAAASAMRVLSMIRRSFVNISKKYLYSCTQHMLGPIWNIVHLFGVLIL